MCGKAKNLTDADKLSSKQSGGEDEGEEEREGDEKEEEKKKVAGESSNEVVRAEDDDDELAAARRELADKQGQVVRMQAELQTQFSQLNELRKLVEIKESALAEAESREANVAAELEARRTEARSLAESLRQYEERVAEMRDALDDRVKVELTLRSDAERLETKIGIYTNPFFHHSHTN